MEDSQGPVYARTDERKGSQTVDGGMLPKSTADQPKFIVAGAASTIIGLGFMVVGFRRNSKKR